MSLELIYTSAPRGLKPNSSGFCTVAMTAGMSRQVMTKLESLSGYEFHFNLSDPNAHLNPTNCVHTRPALGGGAANVLSQVAFAGADYSGRTNKIAHHFLLGSEELLPGGPAWMMGQMSESIFRSAWQGDPQELPPRSLDQLLGSRSDGSPRPARRWGEATGDPGWAGVLAASFRGGGSSVAYIIYRPGADLLPLFEESLAILPPVERWAVCFATYFTAAKSGCHYHWRGVVAGSKAAKAASRFRNAAVIDLTSPIARAEDNPYTEAARAGQMVEASTRAEPSTARRRSREVVPIDASALAGTRAVAVSPFPGTGIDLGSVAAPSSPLASPASLRGRARAGAPGVRHWRALALALAALAAVLAALCAVTLLRSRKSSADPERVGQERAEAKAKLASLEANLKMAQADAAGAREELERAAEQADEKARDADEKLATRSKKLDEATKALKMANDKMEWFKRMYYATQGHKKHPDDEPSAPTPTGLQPDGGPGQQAKLMRLVRLASQDAAKARGFQKRADVFPLPPKQDTRTGGDSYPPKPCDGFLDPPKELSEFLALREENKALLVTHRGNNPVKTELLRCTLDSGDGFAVTPRNARAATEYAARIKYLVLEAVSLADKVVHRYQHRCEPVTKVLPLKYGGDGAAVPVKTSFAYPWPEALAVNCKDLNGGKPFPLFPKGSALSMGSDIASTDGAETKVRFVSGRRLREITLKRPMPRAAGETFQLLLRFSPPGAADGETRGAQGDSGAGGGPQVRVSLSALDLARYFGAIDAERPHKSWAALRERLDELIKLKQEAEKLLEGPTKSRRELEGKRIPLEHRKRELEGYVASHKRASEIGERLGPIVKRLGEIDKRWHAIEKKKPKNEELRKEQAALKNEEGRLAREKDKEEGDLLKLMDGLPKELRNAKPLERKAKEAAAELPEIERSLQGIRGELGKVDREIEEKKKDISKRKADCDHERDQLRDVPARCFQDVGPVEILDPWGRVLWVIVPRLERAK